MQQIRVYANDPANAAEISGKAGTEWFSRLFK
jgi:hypothetical protein